MSANKIMILLLFSLVTQMHAQEEKPNSREYSFQVEKTKIHNQKGRKITVQRIAPLNLPKKSKISEVKEHPDAASPQVADSVKQHSFAVSATVYDQKTSLIKWWSLKKGEKQQLSCWSNINWNHLSGSHEFQIEQDNYTFMFFVSNSTAGNADIEIPKELLPFEAVGARYIMVDGDEENEASMDFIEAVHKLYDQKKEALVNNYHDRLEEQKEREHQLKVNPPKPKDLVIRYWRNDTEKNSKKN